MFVHLFLKKPVAARVVGRKTERSTVGGFRVFEGEEGQHLTLNHLPRRLPGGLKDVEFSKIVIQATGVANPPTEGIYENDPQLACYATVEVSYDKKTKTTQWFIRVEGPTFIRVREYFNLLREGKMEPVRSWTADQKAD
ncbi:MAG TPA: hypothetical protein VIF43_01070 [Patescibacteria group bacterium]|jgi:hypothetical protein